MESLSKGFLNNCRRENGFIIRGEAMTRVETFVDAAFAFAITMLIISVDEIPKSVADLFRVARDIPAFITSGMQIGLIWYNYSLWSRRFGLQDGTTVALSLALVMLVLIFIYPLKLVFMGMFNWLSDGYLSPNLGGMTLNDLSNLFVFFAAGFIALSSIDYYLYHHTLKKAEYLCLTDYEKYYCESEKTAYIILAVTALISAVMAKTLPGLWIISAGFIYTSLAITSPIWYKYRDKNAPSRKAKANH